MTIDELYQQYSNLVLRQIKDQDKFNLEVKHVRLWKERLFSIPWRPWEKYSYHEIFEDVTLDMNINDDCNEWIEIKYGAHKSNYANEGDN